MNIKPLEDNDPIYISRLMMAYCSLSKQGKQRIRIIFRMIFEDEDSWQVAEDEVARRGQAAAENDSDPRP